MTALISVQKAQCRIGRHGVLRVDQFEMAMGQHWCLFGANGSGKTLLANLICGKRLESGNYVQYASGFDVDRDIYLVSFEEQQRLWLRDNRLDISEFSENIEDKGTIVSQLIKSTRSTEDQNETLFEELSVALDLNDLLAKGIRFLSSGQIRKVLIARALYGRSSSGKKLVVLDDPLESIDRNSQQQIASCIEQHLGEDCVSLQLCRRHKDILPGVNHMAIMQDLALVQAGPLEQVMASSNYQALLNIKAAVPRSLPKSITNNSPESDSNQSLIELKSVSASYGELRVLDKLSWKMEAEHHVLIEGPNGCGKSTLLSLIDGENHKGYGQEVYLFGKLKGSGETIWDVKAQFGIVSNELHNKYIKGWRVLDVVVSGFFDSVGLYDDSGTSEIQAAREWLETLGIGELAKHYYHEISFGQQRLVLLARAMVKSPSVLILDEPCVGLDDYHRQMILKTLDVIADLTKTKLLYVSHVEGEFPDCINQKLSFVSDKSGGFKVEQSVL